MDWMTKRGVDAMKTQGYRRGLRAMHIVYIIFLVCVACGCLVFFWYAQGEMQISNAEGTTSTVTFASGVDTSNYVTIDASFYNYKYDREIYNNARDQAMQSCTDNRETPYKTFNSLLSEYYKDKKVVIGAYEGNFCNYYGWDGAEAKCAWPGYKNFYWASNISNRKDYAAVCQGIVADKLSATPSSTDPTAGQLMTKTSDSKTVAVPFFDSTFVKKTVKVNGADRSIGNVKENVGFPMRKTTSAAGGIYYEFDSTKEYVSFHNKSGSFSYSSSDTTSDKYYFGDGSLEYTNKEFNSKYDRDSANFFPFNTSSSSLEAKNLDYGFGVRFNIPFYLTDDGKINGEDIKFTFKGDDDVWVFIDGQLVLDIGGMHSQATGTLNFAGTDDKVKSTIDKVIYIDGATDATKTATSNYIHREQTNIKKQVTATHTVTKGQKHVMTVFYMERGMFGSSFYMKFNFVPEPLVPVATAVPTATPTVASKPTEHVNRFTIQNKVTSPTAINAYFATVMPGLLEDDVFSYTVKNKGTTTALVGDSGIKYPSGQLSVRENGGKKRYLSWGQQGKVRIYFDVEAFMKKLEDHNCYDKGEHKNNKVNYCSKYKAVYEEYYEYSSNSVSSSKKISTVSYEKDKYYYYADFNIGDKLNYSIGIQLLGDGQGDQYITYKIEKKITVSSDMDGKLLVPQATPKENSITDLTIPKAGYTLEPESSAHPKLNSMPPQPYSTLLPTCTPGTVSTFKPTDSATNTFQPVTETSYQLNEAYPAPTATGTVNKEILANSVTTSGITSETSGHLELLHDDAATFINQFAKNSYMQVTQSDNLYCEKQPTPTPYALVRFATSSPTRSASDYYYTKVSAVSKDTGLSDKSVSVDYQGISTYENVQTKEHEVNIVQTFENQVKTGNLQLDVSLEGNAKEKEYYGYQYTISFKTVYGSRKNASKGTEYDLYKGEYQIKEGDSTTNKKTTDGTIGPVYPGQKVVIEGIPVGTTYRIVQTCVKSAKDTDGAATEASSKDSCIKDFSLQYETEKETAIVSPNYTKSNATVATTSSITTYTFAPTLNTGVTKCEVETVSDSQKVTLEGTIPTSIVDKSDMNTRKKYQNVEVAISFMRSFGSFSFENLERGDVGEGASYNKEFSPARTDTPHTYRITYKESTWAAAATAAPYTGICNVIEKEYKMEEGWIIQTPKPIKTSAEGVILLTGSGMTVEIPEQKTGVTFYLEEQIPTTELYYVSKVLDEQDAVPSPTPIIDYVKPDGENDENKFYSSIKAQATAISKDNLNPSLSFYNHFGNSNLYLEKYVDAEYYGDTWVSTNADKPKEGTVAVSQGGVKYSEELTMQELVEPSQSFIYTIYQYKTKEDAEKNTTTKAEKHFQIVLSMQDKELLKEFKEGCPYVIKKTVKVRANRYYRVVEDTSWSWKYKVSKIFSTDKDTRLDADAGNTNRWEYVDGNLKLLMNKMAEKIGDTGVTDVVLKDTTKNPPTAGQEYATIRTYPDDNIFPMVQFFGKLRTDVTLEGDTSSEKNTIKIKIEP